MDRYLQTDSTENHCLVIVLKPFESLVMVLKQVGGWSQQYAGLNFVIVRGAGHEVPLHKAKEALALFNAFISGTPLTHDKF